MSKEKITQDFDKRLQKLFLDSSTPEIFTDKEILKFLIGLTTGTDASVLADQLLAAFGNIADVINADQHKLSEVIGNNNEAFCFTCRLTRELIRRTLKQEVIGQSIINNYDALIDYLKVSMGCLKVEQFRVLFLNTKNIMLADEILAVGTVDQISIYPREVIKRALYNESSAIILIHNHPSGNTQPSESDILLTNKIQKACNALNIKVHDHIIISKNQYFSFKNDFSNFNK